MKRVYLIRIKKKFFVYLLSSIVFFMLLFMVQSHFRQEYIQTNSISNKQNSGKLAIIIDDFGQSREGVEEMIALETHLTFAVMPFMEHSKEDAENAKANGFEVIVHLPMEPEHGKISWLGPRPILCGMSNESVKKVVVDAFDDVPYAVGANIHMGSKASCENCIMTSVLEVIKEKGLYFVDSRTGKKPCAKKISDQEGIICYENNIFLDGQKPKSHIKKQLEKAGDTALKRGYAIAIGHVGIEGGVPMAEAINEMLDVFKEKNVDLVFVSELQDYTDLTNEDFLSQLIED